ncbi:MAG TPA: hypothetical protein VME92_08865 [Acetobacteraceae bacterium]|nr:hypothetical protein [Acetobacteraceae bacterium]
MRADRSAFDCTRTMVRVEAEENRLSPRMALATMIVLSAGLWAGIVEIVAAIH